jgi:hypothetical protein
LTRYFDASALAKRYLQEQDTVFVRRLLAQGSAATSRLSFTEVASALVRRCREGTFSIAERDRALAALALDFRVLYVVELTPEISTLTMELLVRHPLRTGDALQLASCLFLQQQLGRPVQFVVYDTRLTTAARQEALMILP